MVCSRSRHGLYHSRYLGLKGLIFITDSKLNNFEMINILPIWKKDMSKHERWKMYFKVLFIMKLVNIYIHRVKL